MSNKPQPDEVTDLDDEQVDEQVDDAPDLTEGGRRGLRPREVTPEPRKVSRRAPR